MSTRLRLAWALVAATAVVVVPLRVVEIAAAHATHSQQATPAAATTTAQR